MTAALQVAMLTACAVIFWRADQAVACLCGTMRPIVRLGYWALAMGALGQIGLVLLYGDVPSLPAIVVASGAALLMLAERRLRALRGGRLHRRRLR